MAFFQRTLYICQFIPFLFLVYMQIVLTKECKKLDVCRCEMDDGSGIIDLWDLDNSDGTPRYNDIHDLKVPAFSYSFNPCTPITTSAVCNVSKLCQYSAAVGSEYPCGLSDPTFTVDESNNVVMNFANITRERYTRSTRITLVCNRSLGIGSFGKGIYQIPGQQYGSSTYMGTLTTKSACLVPSHVPRFNDLSTGSILLIIFSFLVMSYLVFGIIFNATVRSKRTLPEVLPNYTFWANSPYLVKDGCVFLLTKSKRCCCFLYTKARGQQYVDI